jgi:hypothetical protein
LASQARTGGAARLLLVRASFATDRMIRRRSIRMICAGPPVSRRVMHNRGPTVLTVLTGRDCRRGHRFRQVGARRRSPRITTRVRNRGVLAPGLTRVA